MGFAIELAGYGAILPLATALAVATLIGRAGPPALYSRYGVPVSFAAGFVAAWAMFPWAPLQAQTHWHYLPWLTSAAALTGAVGTASGVAAVERWLLYALIAAVAAWLIVPDWEDIISVRTRYVGLLSLATLLLSVSLDFVAARTQPALLLLMISLAFVAGAVVTELAGFMKMAQLAGAAAAATGGSFLGACWCGRDADVRGAASAFAVLLVGLLFSGYVNSFSSVPVASYALVPAAIIGLGLAEFAGSRSSPRRRATMRILVLMIPLIVAILLAVRSES